MWIVAVMLLVSAIGIALAACSSASVPELMKRKPSPKVLPVVANGQKYEAMTTKPGVIKVTQLSGGMSREIVIYEQSFERGLEKDVQVRFISALKLEGKALVVEVEDGRVFAVSVDDDKVTERLKP